MAEEPLLIRGSEDVLRSDEEGFVSPDWTGNRFAINVRAGFADDPMNWQRLRIDGAYATKALGKWMVGTALVNRWCT